MISRKDKFYALERKTADFSGAPNENIVQNRLNIAFLNVF